MTKIKETYEENIRNGKSALQTIEQLILNCEKHRRTDIVEIANIARYVLLWNIELSYLLSDIITSEDDFKKKLLCRILALMLYEVLDDLNALMSRKIFNSFKLPADIDQVYSDIMTQIRLLRRKHEKGLKRIRNFSIAHRELDTGKFLNVIKQINIDDMIQLCNSFTRWATNCFLFLSSIIRYEMNKIPIVNNNL